MASDDQPLLPPPDEPRALPAPSRSERRTIVIIVGSLVGLLVIAFLIGYFLHYRRERAAEAANEKMRSSLPAVNVVAVKPSTATSELVLPGSITPIIEASLYARASGYVERRYVDIGDRVRRSQVLAEIESPELDQQVSQARAAVAQARQQLGQANASVVDARAKLDLARVTAERYRTLLDQDSVSRQDADQRQQEFRSAEASLQSTNASVGAADENVRAADANLRRLVSLQDFEKVRAPFDGIITARNVDVGALISNAGGSLVASALSGATTAATAGNVASANGQGSELFRIAQIDQLRVLVGVPQENAAIMRTNMDATIFVQEVERRFVGKVTRTANALDPVSRTLLTEVKVANPDLILLPGMYAQVRFNSARSNPPLLVPGEALILRGNGAQLAILRDLEPEDEQKIQQSPDRKNAKRIHLQPIEIGRDYGTEIEVTGGLEGGEYVVVNPGDAVREGAIVLPREASRKETQANEQKPGGRSDRAPSGIQSPSMPAPTQGAKSAKGNKKE